MIKLKWNGFIVMQEIWRGGADNSKSYFVPDSRLNINVAFACIANLNIDLV